jgi:N-acetylglucosaminyldiphosphoundecaprenol N-acetyl-beta-D-mannosaminyltransferase
MDHACCLAAETEDRLLSIQGVRVMDTTRPRAVRLLLEWIARCDGRPRTVFFVNAHTLNLAAADATYRAVLNAADRVFADGTGVRWAARLAGARLQDNVNGTDLMPELFRAAAGYPPAGRGYRCFLLGGDDATVRRAAGFVETLGGWTVAGVHHGYLAGAAIEAEVLRRIRDAQPDILLVGMGNPLQERWIHAHRDELEVPLAVGVGGLLNFWAGNVPRAPAWLRRWGAEWLFVLWNQPQKARRYLLGNPLFLARVLGEWWPRAFLARGKPQYRSR